MELQRYNAQHLIWSERKNEFVKQLRKSALNDERNENWDERLSEHLKQEPSKPRQCLLMHQNTSERALLDSLDGQSQSIAVICDEGEIILHSPLLKKLGVLNTSWGGGTLSLNRANGTRITARDPRLTISMMAQSSVFSEYLEKLGANSRGTGFFARFLMAWPQSTQGYRVAQNTQPKWERLTEFHNLIREALQYQTKHHSFSHPEPITHQLDEDARAYFVDLVNQIELMIQPHQNLSDIHDFASKTGEIVLRIAALFHHFGKQTGEITRDTLGRAMEIVQFHQLEFQRIFSPEHQIPQYQINADSIIKHLTRLEWKNSIFIIPKNEIYRRSGVRNHTRFNTALDFLVQQGIISVRRILPSRTLYVFLTISYFQNLSPIYPVINQQIQPI